MTLRSLPCKQATLSRRCFDGNIAALAVVSQVPLLTNHFTSSSSQVSLSGPTANAHVSTALCWHEVLSACG
ncbi:hypothetical protein NOVOSPHI9U_310062 [Novosphingobium sp. 9U]|nr:hypothetical protein NOVOSPHI9U_310062 [Novosphingobium sp. 9U]